MFPRPQNPFFFFFLKSGRGETSLYIYIYIYILWLEFTGARIVCASNAGHTLCAPVHWSSWLISFQIWTTIWKRSRNLIDLILVELERYGCLISRSSKSSKIRWRTKELWTIEASWHAWQYFYDILIISTTISTCEQQFYREFNSFCNDVGFIPIGWSDQKSTLGCYQKVKPRLLPKSQPGQI